MSVHKSNNQFSYWEIKVSIARAVALEAEPTVDRLRNDIMEEFGYPPEPELIDFFVNLIGESNGGAAFASEAEKRLMAEEAAREPGASVLKFRTEFKKRFKDDPPHELTGYFLKKIQDHGRSRKQGVEDEAKFDFAREKAGESYTVLQFRAVFKETFYEDPSSELLSFFLKNIS